MGVSYKGVLQVMFYNQLEMKNDKINLEGASDSYAVARVSRRENPEALQGFHSDNLLFIIDEASGVDDMIFEVGEGSLSTPNAKVVQMIILHCVFEGQITK